jgi:hypothetical protein
VASVFDSVNFYGLLDGSMAAVSPARPRRWMIDGAILSAVMLLDFVFLVLMTQNLVSPS